MTLLSLFKNSQQNTLNTLISGSDTFLNDYLAKSYLQEEQFSDYERVMVDCETDGLDNLIAALTESSLFSQKKVLTVKNPFFLTAKVPQKYHKQVEQLQNIFENSSQLDDVIIMVASYEKLDRRKKITKIITQNFNVVEAQVKPYELKKVVRELITSEKYQITDDALKLLLERSDQVLDTVLSNYNKLKMAAIDQKITTALVEKNTDLSLAQNIFAILEVALRKNYQEALTRLDNQLHNGNSPVQLLAVFENQIEFILVVKVLQSRGRSEAEIVRELGVHPFRVKVALRNNIGLQKLEKLLQEAIKLDFNYKNGQYRSENFLRLFILSV